MEILTLFVPIFTATIAFCAVFIALGLLFNVLLSPLKKNQDRIETELASVKTDVSILKGDVSQINSKLDQLLAK